MLTCENLPYPKHQKLFFCLCLTELNLSCLLCSRTSIFQDDKQTLDFVERSWYLYRVILQNKGNPSEEFQKVEANYAASVKTLEQAMQCIVFTIGGKSGLRHSTPPMDLLECSEASKQTTGTTGSMYDSRKNDMAGAYR